MLTLNDLRSIFRATPAASVILLPDSPDFKIVEVNDNFLSVSRARREDILGKPLFDTFPVAPLESNILFREMIRSSFDELVRTKNAQKLPIQRYDIKNETQTAYLARYWRAESSPVLNDQGEVAYIIYSSSDVTDKIISETHSDILINNTEESFILTDKDLTIVSFNKQFSITYQQYFGGEIEVGKSILNYAKEGRAQFMADLYQKILAGESVNYDIEISPEGLPPKHFRLNYKPAQTSEGELFGAFVSIIDVTEQKESQNKLEANEKRFRALVENGEDAVAILSAAGKPVYISPSTTKMLGFFEEELLTKNIISFIHNDDIELVNEILTRAIDQHGVSQPGIIFRMIHKHGGWRWVESVFTNLIHEPTIRGIIVNFRDITEKREAELKLINSEKVLKEAQRIARIGNWKLTLANQKLEWSEEVYHIFDQEPGEESLDYETFLNFVHPDDQKRVIEAYSNSIVEKTDYNISYRILTGSGKIKYVIEECKTYHDKKGHPEYSYGTVQDITEQTLAHENVRKSQAMLQKILDRSLDVICTLDSFGRYKQVSAASLRLWGYTPEEMIGRSFVNFVFEEDHIATTNVGVQVIGEIEKVNFENRYVAKDGTHVHMEWSIRWDEAEGLLFCVGKDVTERKKIQALIESERRENEALINSTEDLVWSVSKDLRILAANNAFLRSLERYSGLKFSIGDYLGSEEVFGKDFVVFWESLYNRALAGENFKYEMFFPKSELMEEDVWSEIRFNPIYGEGEIIGIVCYERNMTERKLAEEKIRISEAELAEAQRLAKLGSWNMDRLTGKIIWSGELDNIFEVDKEIFKLDYDSVLSLIEEGDRQRVSEIIEKAFLNGEDFRMEYRITTPKGNGKNIQVVGYVNKDENGEVTRLYGTAQDVTETIQTKMALIESNIRYEYVSKATFDAIWDWDLKKDHIFWGENFEKIFGHPLQTLKQSSESWTDHIHPDDYKRVKEKIFEHINGTKNNWDDKYRFKKANGDYAYVIDRGVVIRDSKGKGIRMIGAMQDVTIQKEREEHLNLLESVITNADDAVLITEAEPFDEPGPRIIYVNEAFTRMTGYTAEEVIGKTPRILQGPKSDQGELQRLGRALRKWQPCEIETINYKKNGEEFWISFSVTPVADETGWFTHWIAIERDVTERKKQENEIAEANKKIENILESIQDGFYSVDNQWIVTYWNKELERLSGIARENIVGKNLWDILPEKEKEKIYPVYQRALESSEAISFEEYFDAWGGWSEISIYPSENGLTIYFKNISERKDAEQKLNELHGELKKNVKALAISNAELEQFAYVASHDLQEPLRMVSGFLTQLEKKYEGVLDEKGKKYIFFAVDGAKRMRQIILDLLEFSRIGRGHQETEDIDTVELVEEILLLNQKIITEKQAKIRWTGLPVIHGSRTTIRQVFQNLILNGLKYQKAKVKPEIEIKASEDETHWQFSIADNGIGIAPEYFEKIFVIFQRLHNREEYSGTGMGLAICKKIVENHKGRIWVESKESEGSTFYFTIRKGLKGNLGE